VAYVLVSFELCPYVQRSVITLEEKGAPYTIEYIDLAHKPDWFLAISPLGKVPVLRVGEAVVFESAVICEYIEETAPGPRLHPEDPLQRAHDRAWIEVGSELLRKVFKVMHAKEEAACREAVTGARGVLARFEDELRGPFFGGEGFSLVDAAVAPALQRLAWCEEIVPLGAFAGLPAVSAWCDALLARSSVQRSLVPEIRELFAAHIKDTWLGRQA
jgi:glutathione S-transferase